ncbi:MAG: inositol monophosphatase [bacterium]|nr:inositol monophosphatase [bacterium]
MPNSPSEQLSLIRRLALSAGETLLQSMGQVGQVSRKDATELVTDLDGRVEEMLLENLTHHFPNDHILAEETGTHKGDSGRTWYVDPLDGTTNYAHGLPTFAVSIACGTVEQLELACVYAPYLDEMYLASFGGGAVLERPAHEQITNLKCSRVETIEEALMATGFPYVRDEKVDLQTDLVASFLKSKCHGVRRAGSAAVDLVHVAAGKLDGYFELNLRPWDSAAGTLIAREAGAIVSGYDGQQDAMHFKHVVAAAPGLHQAILPVIQTAWEKERS